MKCRACGGLTSVVETRLIPEGVLRRRLCQGCGYRFVTSERALPTKSERRARNRPAKPVKVKPSHPPSVPRVQRLLEAEKQEKLLGRLQPLPKN